MAQYIEVIKTAFLLFPLAALAVTLPYMVVEYKKFGPFQRCAQRWCIPLSCI